MRLQHNFTVPVPVETAWRALLDPERVAPCFPGATLTGVDGPEFTGTVKVRLGPVSLLYKGTGRFTSVDEAARRLILQASGKDARGNGTATATVAATLSPVPQPGSGSGTSTAVGVVTDLTITGRPAQLGRGLVSEVSGKILSAFAGCLATELASPADAKAPQQPAEVQPAGEPFATARVPAPSIILSPAPEPNGGPDSSAASARPAGEIDLLHLAGKPVIKRLVPVLAAVFAVLQLLRWLRHRR